MVRSQFDALAAMYEEFSELPFREHLEFPSVLALAEPAPGLRVLDLGCGSGVYSRRLAERGARVTGIDESAGMIAHAVEREERERLGITYHSGALPDDLAGTFDLVLAVYVLPYATDFDELVRLCRRAATALRPGGRFLTLPIHPSFHPDADYYAPYGFRLHEEEPRRDASPVGLDLRFGTHEARVTARFWTAVTLEGALAEAGFAGTRWRAHRLSERAAAHRPFFRPYLDVPHAAIIDTVKEVSR
ncbi:class I SAM-dependent methyltransferase [Streptomyces sp. NPDC097619]|uniref:class I SAM-dependent methyltransferase n=1 Tax=Streptomyces sp. NPDC097619 TaxID=3157228 RepID=UPI0033249331